MSQHKADRSTGRPGPVVLERVHAGGSSAGGPGSQGVGMNVWTVQVTISTNRRVDAPTVAALLAGATACQKVSCSHGVPGVSVLLVVEAATAAGAYGAALVRLVTEVLPRLEGPVLTDVLISTGAQSLSDPERPARGMTGASQGETAPA